ncbi:MAG: DUF402 domain-containing protein [Lachnospiraceae bacterium]|nr:DUF402 domain-containing protein [Lachnospiraceae bacterium]
MDYPKLFRKRYIPFETIELKDDKILMYSDELIITSWDTLKPRSDFACGISAYFMKNGYKISRIYDSEGKFVHWYCDIMRPDIKKDENGIESIYFVDLLMDVIIKPDGRYFVVDSDEAADALDNELVDAKTLSFALRSLDTLLKLIYDGGLENVKIEMEKAAGKAL